MIRFYDNPETGKVHFSAPAGGQSGLFDCPATPDLIVKHPAEFAQYHLLKTNPEIVLAQRGPAYVANLEQHAQNLKAALADAVSRLEALTAENADLKRRLAKVSG